MEILEFANIQRRMCKTYDCVGCPLNNRLCRIAMDSAENDEEIISIVEAWVKENPGKTRQSEILKLHPNAKVEDDGVLLICPGFMDENFKCCGDCDMCRKRYWLEEIE